MTARRLVLAGTFPDVGRVRVTYSGELGEYCVRLVAPDGQLVAEYFTDDRADALGTADALMRERGASLGIT